MSARDIVMANKLKEGVQDALVYLRLLEGAKLAPVYERKRVQLMARLLDVQGDTRKEAPPKLDDDTDDEEDAISEESTPKHDAPGTPDKKGAPERRNSKLDEIKNKFNQPAGKGSYRYKTLEELKKESAAKKSGVRTDSVSEEPPEEEEEEKEDEKPQPKREKTPPPPPDSTSQNEIEELKEEDEELPLETAPVTPALLEPAEQSEKKGRSHTLGSGLIGKFFKGGKGKERSLSIPDPSGGSTDNISQLSAENSTISLDQEEQQQEEEPGKFTSQLERVMRRLGKYTYQKGTATLNNDIFHFMKPKDKTGTTLSLVGAATAIRDSYQFELHTVDKSYTFRTDSEELCIKWVDLLKAAIDVCSPPQEDPVQEEIEEEIEEEPPVPQITIQNTDNNNGGLTVPDNGVGGGGGNIKESLSYENFAFGKKKKQEMPDASSVQVKGFIYKKGKFGWDKVWIVLTYDNTLFMSPNETSKKVLQVIPVTPDTKVEKKKSPDKKYPHGLMITSGKIKETLATDSQSDFDVWISYLSQAAGAGDIQELLSEDEDGGELYEELELKDEPSPGLPHSPRPNHASFAPPPTNDIEEELYDDFDGDIYEGLDEIDVPPNVKRSPPPLSIPSLPPRNDPKVAPPTLPPRNQPQEPAPSLPPRPTKGMTAAMDYEAPLPSPKQKTTPITQQQPIDDEIYDDVMGGGGIGQEDFEETYDDVVSTQSKMMNSNRVSSGDLYEDMVATSVSGGDVIEEEQEEYCDMILPQHVTVTEDPDELYVDVDTPPRPPPPTTTNTTTSKSGNIPSRPPPPATASVSRPPPLKTTPTTQSPLLKQKSDESPSVVKKTVTEQKASTLPKSTSPSQSPSAVARSLAKTGGAKRMSTGPSKVAELSKKFGDAPTQGGTSPKNKRGTHSGTILYMGPGKTAYSSDWCVLEGTTLIFYKGPNEKLSHYRLSTKEAELHMGQPDGKGSSQFAFYIKKGSIVHKFSTNTLQELGEWIGHIAHVIAKVFPPPDCLYQAKEDHSEEGGVSFNKDDIVWVLGQDTPTKWIGVVGKTVNEFTGAQGTFPSNKIGQLSQNEAMYI